MTPKQIASNIRSNSAICSDTALAMPYAIAKAIGKRHLGLHTVVKAVVKLKTRKISPANKVLKTENTSD